MIVKTLTQIHFSTVYIHQSSQYIQSLRQLILDRPVICLILALIATFALAILTKKLRSYFKGRSHRFLSTLSGSESVTVLMHSNPDPDCMACAMAVKRLLEDIEVKTRIVYPGRISHDENRAFRTVLDVSFERIQATDEIEGDDLVMVDHNNPRGLSGATTIIPEAIIDHHPKDTTAKDNLDFLHIDESIGSCSTILTEYLVERGYLSEESEDSDVSEDLATALYYGIKSDTDDISRCVSDRDFEAINVLYNNINQDKLHRISNPKVDKEAMETKARAIMGRDVRSPFAVSDVGPVQISDSIPQSADELIKLEGISAAVIIGNVDGSIRISGRAYDDRIHMGDAISRVVEDIEGSSGGGHARMGGGKIPKRVVDSDGFSRTDTIQQIFSSLNRN